MSNKIFKLCNGEKIGKPVLKMLIIIGSISSSCYFKFNWLSICIYGLFSIFDPLSYIIAFYSFVNSKYYFLLYKLDFKLSENFFALQITLNYLGTGFNNN